MNTTKRIEHTIVLGGLKLIADQDQDNGSYAVLSLNYTPMRFTEAEWVELTKISVVVNAARRLSQVDYQKQSNCNSEMHDLLLAVHALDAGRR